MRFVGAAGPATCAILATRSAEAFSPRASRSPAASTRLGMSIDSAPPPDFFTGSPSTPGFRPGEFDKLSSWALSTTSNRPAVAEYDPDAWWLWAQWEGTLKQMTWRSVLLVVIWGMAVNWYAYHHYTNDVIGSTAGISWYSSAIRHSDDAFFELLDTLGEVWNYQLTLTVFTLSFFVNEAYGHWKRVYFSARAMQGRINDLSMLVTAGAMRSNEYGEIDGITGYTSDSKKLLWDTTRFLRLSHAFFWASTPTRSDGLGRYGDFLGPRLLSREGLELLVDYGQLTQREMDALLSTGLPPSQYPYVMLEWAMLRCMGGLRTGELVGGQGLEDNILKQFTQLRAEYFNIGDYATGRMSMAYMIAVEIIVDVLVFTCPLALYTKLGALSIATGGMAALFFKGLLELSKSFLDTFGTEGYRAHNIRVDTLVSEVNFGSSQRWPKAGDALPSESRCDVSAGEIKKLDELQDIVTSVPHDDNSFDSEMV